MWAPISIALLLGAGGSFTADRLVLGVVFAVLLVALLIITAMRSRRPRVAPPRAFLLGPDGHDVPRNEQGSP
jgi:hypothetical protein